MIAVFLLQNQDDQYLGKSGDWLSGSDSKPLFRTAHKDEAINQKVEISVKQASPRVSIISAYQLPNGQVVLAEDKPLPISNFVEQEHTTTLHSENDSSETENAREEAAPSLAFEFENSSKNVYEVSKTAETQIKTDASTPTDQEAQALLYSPSDDDQQLATEQNDVKHTASNL